MKTCLASYQNEYLELLETHENRIFTDTSLVNILWILDDVDKFWRKRLGVIEKDLDSLTESNTCMILSGAIYLDYANNEHYLYKPLGRYHLLHDSLLKLESIIRAPQGAFNHEAVSRLFLKAFQDELMVLRNAREHLFYVPLQLLALKYMDDHHDLLSKGFWSVVSNLFAHNMGSIGEFVELYKSYAEIERALGEKQANTIIFNDRQDENLSIGERTEAYLHHEIGMSNLLKNKSEPEKFIAVLSCHTCQVLDIILTGVCFNITPYIRFKTTFYYFVLIAQSFERDEKIKSMVEKTIITYLFYHEMDRDVFAKIGFDEFSRRMSQEDYLQRIISALKNMDVDIASQGFSSAISVIHSVFSEFESKNGAEVSPII